jgi:hypothetical protein
MKSLLLILLLCAGLTGMGQIPPQRAFSFNIPLGSLQYCTDSTGYLTPQDTTAVIMK